MDKLIRTIENKEIIFVGNSIEILQHKKGEWIDSHDIVVRFGKGMPTPDKYESIGQRTDIWISGFLRSKHQVYYPMALKLLNRARVDLDSDVSRHKVGKDWITMFTDDELKSIYEEFGIKNNDFHAKRPSNGFISILFLTPFSCISNLGLLTASSTSSVNTKSSLQLEKVGFATFATCDSITSPSGS